MPGFYTDGPLATDKGSIFDLEASAGDVFGAGFQRQIDTNPLALVGRGLRTFNEDWNAHFGDGELIDQATAQKEVTGRGLDLKIPMGGISRYELDTLQYLKQREIRQNVTTARGRGFTATAAGFAGGLVASFTDPLNVASGFIPIVGHARYAKWLADAGKGTFARAAVRSGAGALEGVAGAALIEPIVLAGANQMQLDYGLMDSFLNVTFGGVMGGGLHVAGGAWADWRGLPLAQRAARENIADAPEYMKRDAMEQAVKALEEDRPVDVTAVFDEPAATTPRALAELMPEGLLAREVQDAMATPKSPDEIQRARGAHAEAGGEVSEHGPVFDGGYHDAVRKMAGVQDGEARGVLHHDESGPIDIIWGIAGTGHKDGRGMAKLVAYHPEVIDDLPEIIKSMKVVDSTDRRIRLESADHEAAVNLDFVTKDGRQAKTWLLTAFAKKGSAARRTAVRGQAGPRGRTDTTPPTPSDGTLRQTGSKINEVSDDFDRQLFAEKAKPKDRIEAAKADEDDFGDLVDQYREQGHLTPDDEAALKAGDDLASWAEGRAKAFEAAAQCIETA